MPTTSARLFAWAGAALFVLSLGHFLYTYAVTFGNTAVPATEPWRAAAWNVALFGIFAAHHSVFARRPVRGWVAAHVPAHLERSVYVWAASLLLIAVCALWAPLPGVAWEMTGTWRWIMRAPLAVGIWLTLRSAGIIDVWELAGTRQVSTANVQPPRSRHSQYPGPDSHMPNAHRPNPGAGPAEFKTTGPYGLVRHPIYLGWVLVVFSMPTMTMTRLAFAAVSCLYLAAAVPLEERTLVATAGDAYRDYMKRVKWRMVPGLY